MKLNKITVIGGGIMGSGVAQVSAVAGYQVAIHDINEDMLNKAKTGITDSLNKFVAKGKLDQTKADDALANIQLTTELEEAAANADLVIEAVFENLGIKHEVFKKLEACIRPDTILASNTSALPITEIASATSRGERFVGIHFMNPVPLMKGVEVIRGQLTSDETFETAMAFVTSLTKEPIAVVDYAGFIVSRLLDVLMNEAVKWCRRATGPKTSIGPWNCALGIPWAPAACWIWWAPKSPCTAWKPWRGISGTDTSRIPC